MILWHLREHCLKMHFWQCSNIGRKMENQQHKVGTPSKLIENKCQCSNNCTNRRTKKTKIPFTKGVAKNFVCAHKGAPHTMRAFPPKRRLKNLSMCICTTEGSTYPLWWTLWYSIYSTHINTSVTAGTWSTCDWSE